MVVIAHPCHGERCFIFSTSAASNKRQYDASMSGIIHFSNTRAALQHVAPAVVRILWKFRMYCSTGLKLISDKFVGSLSEQPRYSELSFHPNLPIFSLISEKISDVKKQVSEKSRTALRTLRTVGIVRLITRGHFSLQFLI